MALPPEIERAFADSPELADLVQHAQRLAKGGQLPKGFRMSVPPPAPRADDIDFESLGRAGGDDDIDFEGLGKATGAASTLASHRWAGVKGGATSTAPPPVDPESAAIAQRDLRNAGVVGLLSRAPQMGPGISRPATLEEAGGSLGKQALMNVGTSAEAAVKGMASLPYMAARHPLNTAKGLVGFFKDVYKETGRAGLYALLTREHPELIPYLASKGITPTKFVEMVGKDPVNVVGALLTPLAIPKAVRGAKKLAGNVADRAFPGVREAINFNEGTPTPINLGPTEGALGRTAMDPRMFTPNVHNLGGDVKGAQRAVNGLRSEWQDMPARDRTAIPGEQPPTEPSPLVDAAGKPLAPQGQPNISLTPPLDTATALFDAYGNRPNVDIPFMDIGKMPVEDFLNRVEPQWRARYGNMGDVGFEGPGERYLRDLHEASVAANQPATKVGKPIKRDYIITPAEEKAAANLRTKLSSVTLNSGIDPSVLLDLAVQAARRNGLDFGRWAMDLADMARKAGINVHMQQLDELWSSKEFQQLTRGEARTPIQRATRAVEERRPELGSPRRQAAVSRGVSNTLNEDIRRSTQVPPEQPLSPLEQELTTAPDEFAHLDKAPHVAPQANAPIADPPTMPASSGASMGDHVLDYLANNMSNATTANLASTSNIANGVVNSVVGALRSTHPRLYHLANQAPDLFAAVWRRASAPHSVKVTTLQLLNDGLYKILNDPAKRALFGQWLVDENIRGVMADPARAGSVNTSQLLSPQQLQAIANDTVMQSAKQYWDAKIKPEIEGWKADAGITSTRSTPGDMYAKLIPETAQKQGPGNRFGPFRKRKAGASRTATASSTYSTDLNKILEGTLMDRVPKARHNQLINIVKGYEVKPDPVTGKIPTTVQWANGKDVPVVRVEIKSPLAIVDKQKGTTTYTSSHIAVPEPVAHAYNTALNPERFPQLGAFNGINNLATSAMLASPAEAIMHGLNVMGAAFTTEGMGSGTRFGKLARWEPVVGRMASIMADVFDLHGPSFEADIAKGARDGWIRAGMFGGEESLLQSGKYNPLGYLKRKVFDYPNVNKRGLNGFETRIRVAAYRALKSVDPTLTDMDAAKLINNQFGTYVQGIQPALVQAMRQVPIFGDPFAAAGVALTKSAFKGLAGKGAKGFSPEVAWSVYGSLIIAPMVLNKLLDPEHRWPWQIPGLKYGDIRVYKDNGKTIDVPMRLYSPAVVRGLNVLGTRQQITRIMNGEADPTSLASDALIGAHNTLIHRFGPFYRFYNTASTGTATHLTPQGEPLRLTDKSARNQVAVNLRQAFAGLNSVGEGVGDERGRVGPSTTWGQHLYGALNSIGAEPIIRGPESQLKGSPIRGENARTRDVAYDIASKALNIEDIQERNRYINERIARDLPDSIAGKKARQEIYKLLRGTIQKSRAKSAALAGQEK